MTNYFCRIEDTVEDLLFSWSKTKLEFLYKEMKLMQQYKLIR